MNQPDRLIRCGRELVLGTGTARDCILGNYTAIEF